MPHIGLERIDQLPLNLVVHREVVKGVDDDRRLVRCSMSDLNLGLVPSRNDEFQHPYVS